MIVVYILIAILILLLMITIHEFGHYLAGKLLGFKIDEFSIGFGPKLFQKKKKDGELFSIRLLPLGGYCAFAGESDEEKVLAPEKMGKNEPFDESNGAEKEPKETKQSQDVSVIPDPVIGGGKESGGKETKKFNEQPPWKRIIVLMAGGVFNILSAVIFSFLFIAIGGASSPTIVDVYPDAPMGTVVSQGLMSGDVVYSVDGTKVDFYHNFTEMITARELGDEMHLVVIRNGEKVNVTMKIREYLPDEEVTDGKYPVGLGISMQYERASIGEAFKYCVPYTGKLSWAVLKTFGQLITGKVPLSQVSGPVGTVKTMADYGMQNAYYLLVLMPLIAVNLGIFNLFPIPALDGSKVVFTIIEWIRGKPINQKVESMIHLVGLIVLFSLVIILDLVNFIMGVI